MDERRTLGVGRSARHAELHHFRRTGSRGGTGTARHHGVTGGTDLHTFKSGALFHLADLSPGDPLTITTTTGATITYRVQARRVYVKAQGLPATLFDQNVPARLVLISCGGSFDPTIGSYRDNIAIFATPTV